MHRSLSDKIQAVTDLDLHTPHFQLPPTYNIETKMPVQGSDILLIVVAIIL